MIWGLLATMGAQVAITWYVGRLGVRELAAAGFIFPVIMTVRSLDIGLAAGTSSAIARALGGGEGVASRAWRPTPCYSQVC
jgi:Na+-driven multidrug efflux pump